MMEVGGLFDWLRSGVLALGSALQTHLHAACCQSAEASEASLDLRSSEPHSEFTFRVNPK